MTVAPTGARTTTIYDLAGRAIAATNALGYITTIVYNAANRPIAAVDPLGARWTTVYDLAGMPVAQVAPDGGITTTVYDVSSRPVATINALGMRPISRSTASAWATSAAIWTRRASRLGKRCSSRRRWMKRRRTGRAV